MKASRVVSAWGLALKHSSTHAGLLMHTTHGGLKGGMITTFVMMLHYCSTRVHIGIISAAISMILVGAVY